MFDDTTLQESLSSLAVASTSRGPELEPLRTLLVGASGEPPELPSVPDLAAGTMALANGTRHKVTLPLGRTPAEFALLRRGEVVLVDCYSTASQPEVFLQGRQVALQALLRACTRASRSLGDASDSQTTAAAMAALADRVESTKVVPDPHHSLQPVHCTGGSLDSPGTDVALSFGFSASIAPAARPSHGAHAFADVHALLFDGTLWCFCGGRRLVLLTGPIMLAAQRMVGAVDALLQAWQADRPLNIRLCSGGFSIAVRMDARGTVSLRMVGQRGDSLTWPALDVRGAALPILRLATDLTRKLVAVDRSQSNNLRVKGLRAEVRRLRRIIRARHRLESFENQDPERLQLSVQDSGAQAPRDEESSAQQPGRLRYTQRWSAEIDSLDAGSVFLCGERVLVATPKLTLALSRNDGDVLWSQPTARATSMMAGRTLLRLLPAGEVELCEVESGQVYAHSRLSGRAGGGGLSGLYVGGGELPPIAVLAEGRQRLVALDLRTGEPLWRFRARGDGGFNLTRAGRVLLVTRGDGSVNALDVASGEVVWRFADRVRFCLSPAVVGDIAVVASGEPGGAAGALYGIELFTGKLRWRQALDAAPNVAPLSAEQCALVSFGRSREARLAAFDAGSGEPRWKRPDPGLDNGGHGLPVDGTLIVNTPAGRVVALELESGAARWSRALANPLTDDVPRQLDPILRQGALFIPSAQVHILRPTDGAPLSGLLGCDLVPDFLRVDERGWFYVAEESGHLRAFAAAPHLSLVR